MKEMGAVCDGNVGRGTRGTEHTCHERTWVIPMWYGHGDDDDEDRGLESDIEFTDLLT
jgi:hypothetical protein